MLQWSSAHCVDSRRELIQSSHHPMWKLLPALWLTHPDNTFFFVCVLNFQCYLFELNRAARTKPTRVKLLTVGRWFSPPLPAQNHPHMAATSQGMPPSTSGGKATPRCFSVSSSNPKPVPNTTTSPLTGTGRSRRKPEPMFVWHSTQTNMVQGVSSEPRAALSVDISFDNKKNHFDLVKLSSTQSEIGRTPQSYPAARFTLDIT